MIFRLWTFFVSFGVLAPGIEAATLAEANMWYLILAIFIIIIFAILVKTGINLRDGGG